MEPKTIFDTGKATVGFLSAVLDFIGNSKLTESESQRLLSFYMAIQAYLDVKEDYFLFLAKLDNPSEDMNALLWQAKKLSHLMATRHFQAYRLCDGLDFHVRAHEHTLHDLIRVYKTGVSRSLGFGPKDVAIASAFKSIAAKHLKQKHFGAVYKIDRKAGCFFVGELAVGPNEKYQEFVRLHEESTRFMADLMSELDGAVRRHLESRDQKAPDKTIQTTQKTHG
ncbi:MAG TPA: hypothetical protein VE977_09390 [Pyrinomonadaceae bacterium]|nr:hypothetical protein [Pyrinomonadaceae bacterium]